MDTHRRHAALAASLLLAGCASFELEPLPASHPANPAASAAPVATRSTTLAHAPSDRSAPAAASEPSGAPTPAGPETVVGQGEVIATVPAASQIVLDHGEIPGFMEAMTMGYRVDRPALLEGLKAGDTVRFTIDVGRRAIVAVEKLR